MSITTYTPGMKPGSTARNVAVGILYFLFFPFIPFVLAYLAGTNRNGFADRVAGVPGVSEGGGLTSAAVVFIISFVVVGMIASVLPSEETGDTLKPEGGPGEDEEAASGSESDASEGSESKDSNGADADAAGEDGEETPPEEIIADWFSTHEDDLTTAAEHKDDGDSAYNSGDYSRAVYHYQNALEIIEDLKEDAEAQEMEAAADEEVYDYWNTVTTYFFHQLEFVANHYLAASEMNDGNEAAAAEYLQDADYHRVEMQPHISDIEEWLEEGESNGE